MIVQLTGKGVPYQGRILYDINIQWSGSWDDMESRQAKKVFPGLEWIGSLTSAFQDSSFRDMAVSSFFPNAAS